VFDATFDNFEGVVTTEFDNESLGDYWSDENGCCHRQRRERCTNRSYHIESVSVSAWYKYVTRPLMSYHHLIDLVIFAIIFCMPLSEVEELTNLLITRGYVPFLWTQLRQAEFREHMELLVMCLLDLLGTGAVFRACQPLCSISTAEVRKFYYLFLDAIVDMREEQVFMPRNLTALTHVEGFYNAIGLPGCCGSVDVVHVKWSNCPAGDFNCTMGKESFPFLGFQCITDFNRRILSIYAHFGSRNDMDIVKTDKNVNAMRNNQLFRDARWAYYGHKGHVRSNYGMYLICDNGYFHWLMTICPFKRTDIGSPKEYFSCILREYGRT
jgi:hypothetical protein